MRLRERWDAFWFAPAAAEGLGLCRIVFAGGMLLLFADADLAVAMSVDPVLHQPLPSFEMLGIGVPAPGTAAALGTAWKLALAALAAGAATRIAALASFAGGIYLLGAMHTTRGLHHADALAVIALGILAASRCGDAWSVDRLLRRGPAPPPSGEYRWPFRLVQAGFVCLFFAAGWSKLHESGLGWVTTDQLRWELLRHQYHFADSDPWVGWGVAIAGVPLLPSVVAGGALATELAYPLVLVSVRARRFLVPAGFALLLGFRALLGARFYPLLLAHVFWLPWDRIAAAAAGRVRGRADD